MYSNLIKLIIAEDHKIVADGLAKIFVESEGFDLLGTALDGKQTLQLLNDLRPEIVLLDINMGIMGGPETAVEIRKKLPTIKIVLMSAGYEQSVKKFIAEYQIDGFIIKETGAPEFKQALKDVMNGKKVLILPTRLTDENLETKWELGSDLLRKFKLTKTETEIITAIAAGKSSKMIASEKKLATSTIEKHRQHIMNKTGSRNMADIVTFAIKNGLYKPA